MDQRPKPEISQDYDTDDEEKSNNGKFSNYYNYFNNENWHEVRSSSYLLQSHAANSNPLLLFSFVVLVPSEIVV